MLNSNSTHFLWWIRKLILPLSFIRKPSKHDKSEGNWACCCHPFISVMPPWSSGLMFPALHNCSEFSVWNGQNDCKRLVTTNSIILFCFLFGCHTWWAWGIFLWFFGDHVMLGITLKFPAPLSTPTEHTCSQTADEQIPKTHNFQTFSTFIHFSVVDFFNFWPLSTTK